MNKKIINWIDYKFQAIWLLEVADKYSFLYYKKFKEKKLVQLAIEEILSENYFLHFPPWKNYVNYKIYKSVENIGENIFPYMGGLMICVCKKIIYAKNSKKQNKIPIKNIVAT